MNKKINLIEQILQADYYMGNIEGASLKNNSFTIWTQGSKYSDLIENSTLLKEAKRKLYAKFIKDDGAVILTFQLEEVESTYVADMLNNKKDADGYDLYRIDWKDDRDFRTEQEKDLDVLYSRIDTNVFFGASRRKSNAHRLCTDDYYRAQLLLEEALRLVKQANKHLS